MTTHELMEKRARLWNSMSAFLDSHRNGDGILSAEDDAVYTRMENDMSALTNEIRRSERMDALNKELSEPTSAPLTSAPKSAGKEEGGLASKAYREDFFAAMRGRPLIHNVLSIGQGTEQSGAYLVPTEFEKQIVVDLAANNVVRSIARVITTNSAHKIPVAATHSTAAWTAENGAYTESNPSFTQTTLDAFKLTDLIRISNELLEDSAFDLERYIAEEIARAFGAKEEEAFCIGTGTGQPTGIFTAAGGQVGVTAAEAASVEADEIIDLIYALRSPYRANAKFLMNDATVAAVRKLKDGNGQYLWQPAVQAGQPDRLLGYEVLTSSYAPAMAADAYAIAFGDFQNYWIGDRAGRTLQRLIELYATNGQIGFVATQRLDAKTILTEGIQLLKMGSAS